MIVLKNGSTIEPIIDISVSRSKQKYISYVDDNTPIVFSMAGNYTDKNYNYYSTDVLYNAWKNEIGKEFEFEKYGKRTIFNVSVNGDYIFIETVKSK